MPKPKKLKLPRPKKPKKPKLPKMVQAKPNKKFKEFKPKQQPPAGAAPAPALRPANNTIAVIGGNNVQCGLFADFRGGSEASEGDQDLRFTHYLTCDSTVDVRDNYPNAPNTTLTVGGTQFNIVFVELVRRGIPGAYKRVFLDRKQPAWPTNSL
ncbi:MAG: hypothetical protein JNM56_15020 [Planctomycetia bacterium]|nr:hypothetical protein [Planctomycetia bacterium]